MTEEQLKHAGILGMHWGKRKTPTEILGDKKSKSEAKIQKFEGKIKTQSDKAKKNELSYKKYELDIEKYATLHSLGLLSSGEKRKLAKLAKKMRKSKKKLWKNEKRINKYSLKIEKNIRKMNVINVQISKLNPESINRAKAVVNTAFK